MSNVIAISETRKILWLEEVSSAKRVAHGKSTTDFRRLLSEMRMRPANQRAILRRMLKRAAMNGVLMTFPVAVPAVSTP